MFGSHFRGAQLRAAIMALALFAVSACGFAPRAHAEGGETPRVAAHFLHKDRAHHRRGHRHHAHHAHHGRARLAHRHKRARISIDMRTGAIEPVAQDPFSILGSLFQPPAARAQYEIERGIEAVGQAPHRFASWASQINPQEYIDFIIPQAEARGLNPRMAAHVCMTEGCKQYVGDRGSSFGPYQLHYGGIVRGMARPGLGDKFTAETGLDARDWRTWKEQVIWSLDYARVHGWRHDWFGWQQALWRERHHHHRRRWAA